MKILLISPFFPPEVGSAAHLYFELGQSLQARRHGVLVLTGLPRYHVAEAAHKRRRYPFICEIYQGLKVWRVFNLDVPWNLPVLRGLDQFAFALCAGLAGFCLPDFDAAMVYSPPLPLALAAVGLGRLKQRPVVVNVQDLFPQSAIDLGVLTNPHLIGFFRSLENFLYRRANLIVVHSEGNRRYVEDAGASPGRVAVVPNWVDTAAIKPAGRRNELRRRLGLNDHFIVSFAGVMGYSQDLETVLQAARLLKSHPDIAFLFVGDGVEKPRLLEMAQAEGLDQVNFLPMQPREKYPEVLAASDVCLATLRQEVKTPVVPSKILSIMAAGRPVLASLPLDGDAPRLIAKARCGLCVPPGRSEELARAIFSLYRQPDLRQEMGRSGRNYALQHLSLESCTEQLENLFRQLCS